MSIKQLDQCELKQVVGGAGDNAGLPFRIVKPNKVIISPSQAVGGLSNALTQVMVKNGLDLKNIEPLI